MVRGVVVAGLEIVEAGFRIVVISAVAQRVNACHTSRLRKNVAPCVVGIGGVDRFRQANEIPVGVPRRQGANTVSVIGIICCFSTGRDLHKLAAILPC